MEFDVMTVCLYLFYCATSYPLLYDHYLGRVQDVGSSSRCCNAHVCLNFSLQGGARSMEECIPKMSDDEVACKNRHNAFLKGGKNQ